MSIVQTALVFVGIPAAVVLVVAAVVFGRANERTPRYRPGGPWQFNPVWYLPHPEHTGPVSSLHSGEPDHPAGALDSAGTRPALSGRLIEPATASGGASGEW
ncbi:MAG TPA: hypothetical protein VF714_04740 [Jatrophihabitans sp.]